MKRRRRGEVDIATSLLSSVWGWEVVTGLWCRDCAEGGCCVFAGMVVVVVVVAVISGIQ